MYGSCFASHSQYSTRNEKVPEIALAQNDRFLAQKTGISKGGSDYSLYQKVEHRMNITLISSEMLHQWMLYAPERKFRIVDARPYADYQRGHIPGARWIGWEDWCGPAPTHAGAQLRQPGYWGVLAEFAPAVLTERLEQIGLSSDELVVIYADGPRSKGREGRVGWMLLYYGASSVALLDGGWSGWLRAGGKGEAPAPAPVRGRFKVDIQPERRVRLSQLRQAYATGKMPLLVDARSRAEYDGLLYDYQPRKGRLPTALHLPYTEFFTETGNFVDRDYYLQRIPVEVREAKEIVACCEVGVRSALFALLYEYYTGQVVANFDGSVMEWALDQTLPMEHKI
jgi:thiosulfate/3-mercaptopyruvate sulfurtransferase